MLTISIAEKFEASGQFYMSPNYTNFGFANGAIKYPDGLHSAHAGEKFPIAKIPTDVPFKTGNENPYASRADLYIMQYSDYFIAMNSAADKNFTVDSPAEFNDSKELVSRKSVKDKKIELKPRTTIVLYKNK